MAKISVIVPAYNAEEYIEKCLDSCINQTLKDIQIIVVNDGSTDTTGEIIKKYEVEYSNTLYVETENRGLSAARNKGMEYAIGKYIYFLDSDDWIDNSCLEECYTVLEEFGLDYVTFDSKKTFEIAYYSGKELRIMQSLEKGRIYSGKELIEKYYINKYYDIAVWKNVYRKEFLTRNNLYFVEGIYYEDVPYAIDVLKVAQKTMYIPRIFHNYRIRYDSIMTSKVTIKKIRDVFYIVNYLLSKVDTEKQLRYVTGHIVSLFSYILHKLTREELNNISCYENEIIQEKKKLLERLEAMLVTNKKDDLRDKVSLYEAIILFGGWYSEDMITKLEKTILDNQQELTDTLKKLPFDQQDKKIGVYGSGRNADYVMELYCQLVGDIESEIVFIDSNKETGRCKHFGTDIINVRDIKERGVEEIVVISYIYEEEIVSRIKQLYGDEFKIHTLYEDTNVDVMYKGYGKVYEVIKQLQKKQKRILLMCTPEHSNIGDHFITIAEKEFCSKFMPDYKVIEISWQDYIYHRGCILPLINSEDIILISGGGFLGSLWEDAECVNEIIKDNCKNRIIVLPQSLYYTQDQYGRYRREKDKTTFENAIDLTLCFREKISYKRFCESGIEGVNTELFPDMALGYKGEWGYKRDGVLLCLRSDKESTGVVRSQEIKNHYQSLGFEVMETDMLCDTNISKYRRDDIVKKKLKEIASAKLVITDRLHCMIMCAVTKTPCLAFDNLTQKVMGVYEWIKTCEYVNCVNNTSDVLLKDIESLEKLKKDNEWESVLDKEFERLGQIIKTDKGDNI